MTQKLLKQFFFLQKIFNDAINYSKTEKHTSSSMLVDYREKIFLESDNYVCHFFIAKDKLINLTGERQNLLIFDSYNMNRDVFVSAYITIVKKNTPKYFSLGVYIKFLRNGEIDCIYCRVDRSKKFIQRQLSSKQINTSTKPELYNILEDFSKEFGLTFDEFINKIYISIEYEKVKNI